MTSNLLTRERAGWVLGSYTKAPRSPAAPLLQDGQHQVVFGDEKAAFGNPLGSAFAQFLCKLLARQLSAKGAGKGRRHTRDLAGGLMDELEAEVAKVTGKVRSNPER